MKKVFKVNLGVVMALFAAFGLMSFKVITNNGEQASNWYAVGEPTTEGRPISNEPMSPPPSSSSQDCNTTIQTNVCAVLLEADHDFEYLEEISNPTVAGKP